MNFPTGMFRDPLSERAYRILGATYRPVSRYDKINFHLAWLLKLRSA